MYVCSCVALGRPVEEKKNVQKLKASIWLSEDFPLKLEEQILPIVDLLAISNTHFAKLRDFITLQLPSGFPIKFGKRWFIHYLIIMRLLY